MNELSTLDRKIRTWLEAMPDRAPGRLAVAVMADTASIRRGRVTPLGRSWALFGLATALLLAVALAAFYVGTRQNVLVLPSPTPTPSATPGVQPTPSAQVTPKPTDEPTQPAETPPPSPTTPVALPIQNGPIIVTVTREIPDDPNGATFSNTWALTLDGESRAVDLPSCSFFSPDGRSLAYRELAAGSEPEQRLVIANADGSNPHVVWHGLMNSQTPSVIFWSPNSERVGMTQAMDPNGALIVGERSSGTSYAADWGSHEFPGESAFSPDGQQLATILGEPGSMSGIEVGVVGGPDRRLLATAPFIRAIAWSPDGNTIAYVSAQKQDRLGKGDGDLYFVDLDGTPARLIDGGAESYYSVVWSPDGRFLAVTNDTGPTVVFDRSGTEIYRFTNSGDYIAWSPDSSLLLGGVGDASANVVNVQSGEVTQITYPSTRNDFTCPLAWQPTVP